MSKKNELTPVNGLGAFGYGMGFGIFDVGNLMETAIIGGSAVGSAVLWGATISKLWGKVGENVQFIADHSNKIDPALQILAAATVGPLVADRLDRRVGAGVTAGLATVGIARLVNAFSGQQTVQLAQADADTVFLGQTASQQGASAFLSGAPVVIEQPEMLGIAPVDVEMEDDGLGAYGNAGLLY